MRLLLTIALFLLLPFGSWAAGIVNNSTSSVTSEDSITIVFRNLDSLGQNVGGLDTTRVLVRSGSGDSVFSEVVAGISGRVRQHTNAGDTTYCWSALVADVDGSGAPGVYSVSITAKSDRTGGWLRTPATEYFQIVGWELDDMGDSTGMAAVNTGRALDSLGDVLAVTRLTRDTTCAVLDTLQDGFGSQAVHGVDVVSISGDIGVANSLEAILDGTGGGSLSLSSVEILPVTGPGIRIESNDTGIAVYAGSSAPGMVIQGGAGQGDIVANIAGSVDSVLHTPDSMLLKDVDKQVLAGITADSVLADSLSYRSDGSGSDSSSIARAVWNAPQANHILAGTFGAYLDAEVSGVGGGTGMYGVTIIAYDSLSDQVVPGASVAIRNTSQTALVALGRTDTDGRASFSLDADSFLVLVSAPGYVFAPDCRIEVTGPGTDTASGYSFNPGTPSSPSLCRVYGFLYDLSGMPQAGAIVEACLPDGVTRSGAVLLSPFAVSTASDSLGYFHLDLVPSASLVPQDSRYEITVGGSGGVILRRRVIVPSQTSWRLDW